MDGWKDTVKLKTDRWEDKESKGQREEEGRRRGWMEGLPMKKLLVTVLHLQPIRT